MSHVVFAIFGGIYEPDRANLICSASVWTSKIFLRDLTANCGSDEDEFEESSSIGGVMRRGKFGGGEGGSTRNGVSERPRGVLHGDVRSEGSETREAVELERRRSMTVIGLPRRIEEERECVGVEEEEVIRGG